MDNLVDLVNSCLTAISIALVGGLVRVLKGGKEITVRSFMFSLLAAGFVGFLIALALADTKWGQNRIGFICGIGGYCGAQVLDIAGNKLTCWIEKRRIP